MSEKIRKMDTDLKESIEDFVSCFPSDAMPSEFADELEKFLQKRGFDLGCVVRWKVNENQTRN